VRLHEIRIQLTPGGNVQAMVTGTEQGERRTKALVFGSSQEAKEMLASQVANDTLTQGGEKA